METVFGIILDALLIAAIVFTVVICVKRGFTRIFVRTLLVIAMLAVAFFLAKPAATGIFNLFFRDSILGSVSDKVASAGSGVAAGLENALDAVPGFIRTAFGALGMTIESSSADISAHIASTGSSLAVSITDTVIAPVAITVLTGLCFIPLAILGYIVARILSKSINAIAKLPLLRQINSFLGGVIGVIRAVLLVFVIVFAVRLILPLTGSGFTEFLTDAIDHSFIFKWLYYFDPFSVFPSLKT